MERAAALALVGVLLFGMGMLMPAEQTRDVEMCLTEGEPFSEVDNCPRSAIETVERDVDNEWKGYSILGGLLLGVLAAIEAYTDQRS